MIAANDHPPAPEKVIGCFFGQTAAARDFEVILVDSLVREDFPRVLADFQRRHPEGPAFRYEAVTGKGRAHNLNIGLRHVRGGIVLFFADDFIAPPGLIAAHLDFHRANPEPAAVGIGAGLLPATRGSSFYSWYEASGELFGAPMSADMKSVPPGFFYIGNSSVKKPFLDRCGAFDESFPYFCWDDYEMGLRMAQYGMRPAYIPAATAEHDHLLSLPDRCRDLWELGYSARIHEVKFPQHARVWEERLRSPARAWHWRALCKRVRHALTGNPVDLRGYYTALLERSFVQGYTRARSEYR